MAIKGSAGVVSGLKGAKDIVPVFAGDLVMPFGSSLNLQAGVNFWYLDHIEELLAYRLSVINLGLGAGYVLRLGSSMWLEPGVRGIFALSKVETTVDDGNKNYTTTTTSNNVPGMSFGGGLHFDLGGMDLGPEVWYPIYFDSKAKGFSALNIVFAVSVHL